MSSVTLNDLLSRSVVYQPEAVPMRLEPDAVLVMNRTGAIFASLGVATLVLFALTSLTPLLWWGVLNLWVLLWWWGVRQQTAVFTHANGHDLWLLNGLERGADVEFEVTQTLMKVGVVVATIAVVLAVIAAVVMTFVIFGLLLSGLVSSR
jgi:hypothetical protein